MSAREKLIREIREFIDAACLYPDEFWLDYSFAMRKNVEFGFIAKNYRGDKNKMLRLSLRQILKFLDNQPKGPSHE